MCSVSAEKRSVSRNTFHCPIEFVIGQNEKPEILAAEVMNISDSGLRIYSSYPLCEGQEILIRDRLPNGHQRYRVLWCNKLSENFFEAGLKSSQEAL
jgi:hypothetical protein